MAIAINLGSPFDIETYDGLVAFIIAHLELDTETQAQVPTFIRLAEYELDRMLTVPQRESLSDLVTTSGTQHVDLPVDQRQLRNAYLIGDTGYPLEAVNLNTLFGSYNYTGKPLVYAIADQAMYFGPTPDDAYTVRVTYLTKLPAISSANQTNWLLSNNADAYVYATLIQAEIWLGNDERVGLLRNGLEIYMEEVNRQGNRYRNAGPIRVRSSVVV